jgi:hypothetical protein
VPDSNAEKSLLNLNAENLDESSFLLIAAKLIENILGEERVANFLASFKRLYFQQNYPEAFASLHQFCTQHEKALGAAFVQTILIKSSQVRSDPMENPSRRFFETMYAQSADNEYQQQQDFSVFEDLKKVYNEVKPGFALALQTDVDNYEKARNLLLAFQIMNDSIELLLKGKSSVYKKKDRNRAELGSTLTSNPGIMKSTAPNFADKVVVAHEKPKITIDPNIEEGYSKNNPRTPFVASISGTTFTLMVVLTEYIKQHQKDPNLQQKLNQIVNFWNATYIKEGYHSIKELVDVFEDPHIQQFFTEANISLNFCQQNALDEAFVKAENYALALANRSVMHQELTEIVQKRQLAQRKANLIQKINLIMARLTNGLDNTGRYHEPFANLEKLIRSWAQGKIDNSTFKTEANSICEDLQQADLLNKTGVNAFKQWINEMIEYLSFNLIKGIFEVPVPITPRLVDFKQELNNLPSKK